jgi:hypothetical protein
MLRTSLRCVLVLALGVIVWPVEVSAAEPMGTAFTYQGLLYDANYPADGFIDEREALGLFSYRLHFVGTDRFHHASSRH